MVNITIPQPVELPTRAPDGVWILSRYADVRNTLRAHNVGADRHYAERITRLAIRTGRDLSGLIRGYSSLPMQLDGAEHTTARQQFRQRAVGLLTDDRDSFLPILDGVLASVASDRPTDAIGELIEPFALKRIAAALGTTVETALRMKAMFSRIYEGEDKARPLAETQKLSGLADQLFEEARMILHRGPARLADPNEEQFELGVVVFAMTLAGDALVSLLGHVVVRLVDEPWRQGALRRGPSSLARFVRECTRLADAVPSVYRRVVDGQINLEGATLRAGDRLRLDIGRANCDPSVFADPNRFDPDGKAAPHLAFAAGPHMCVGARAGQTIAENFVARLLEKFSLEGCFDQLAYRPRMITRIYTELPIRLHANPEKSYP